MDSDRTVCFDRGLSWHRHVDLVTDMVARQIAATVGSGTEPTATGGQWLHDRAQERLKQLVKDLAMEYDDAVMRGLFQPPDDPKRSQLLRKLFP